MNLHEMSVEQAIEVARLREANRAAGRPLDAPAVISGTLEPTLSCGIAIDDQRLEKEIVARADKQMRALGFEVVSIGQAGSAKGTKQTPGIPDRRYYHRARRLALWWEAKTPSGRQRPDQKYFEEMCTAVGEVYVLGTDEALFTWLVAQKIAFAHEGVLCALHLPAHLQRNEVLDAMPFTEPRTP